MKWLLSRNVANQTDAKHAATIAVEMKSAIMTASSSKSAEMAAMETKGVRMTAVGVLHQERNMLLSKNVRANRRDAKHVVTIAEEMTSAIMNASSSKNAEMAVREMKDVKMTAVGVQKRNMWLLKNVHVNQSDAEHAAMSATEMIDVMMNASLSKNAETAAEEVKDVRMTAVGVLQHFHHHLITLKMIDAADAAVHAKMMIGHC